MNRIDRDFAVRPELEREWMQENTWCDRCSLADLGINSPREYKENGKIYVEGECRKCGEPVRSEVTEPETG